MIGKEVSFIQVDGQAGGDDSDVDDDDDDDIGEVSIHGDEDDDDADDDKAIEANSEYEGKEDPDPLNSDDDLTEPGSPDSNSDLFDTDNVIVCQYDKVGFIILVSVILKIIFFRVLCYFRLRGLKTDGSFI